MGLDDDLFGLNSTNSPAPDGAVNRAKGIDNVPRGRH